MTLPTACPKPSKLGRIERHERRNERKRESDAIKAEAKRLDGHRCRWPRCEFRAVPQPLDAAHLDASGMGGDPGFRRMTLENLIGMCRLHHKDAPQSLHSKDLKVERLTPAGTRGPCAFWKRDEDGEFYLVAEEISPFVYRRD